MFILKEYTYEHKFYTKSCQLQLQGNSNSMKFKVLRKRGYEWVYIVTWPKVWAYIFSFQLRKRNLYQIIYTIITERYLEEEMFCGFKNLRYICWKSLILESNEILNMLYESCLLLPKIPMLWTKEFEIWTRWPPKVPSNLNRSAICQLLHCPGAISGYWRMGWNLTAIWTLLCPQSLYPSSATPGLMLSSLFFPLGMDQ